MTVTLSPVIPGRAKRESGIQQHHDASGFRPSLRAAGMTEFKTEKGKSKCLS